MEWGVFWGILILGFFYMIWAVFYGGNIDKKLAVTPEAAALAPSEAIDAMMMDFRNQGYTVEHVKNLEQDPEHVNRALIEYVVSSQNGSDQWVYTWAWEVPVAFTTRRIQNEYEEIVYERLVAQCRLIPLSEAANQSQEILDRYIADTQD